MTFLNRDSNHFAIRAADQDTNGGPAWTSRELNSLLSHTAQTGVSQVHQGTTAAPASLEAMNVAPVHTDPVTEVAPTVGVARTTSLFTDGDGDGKADPGDTLVTHVDITNPTGAPITNVSVTDTLNGTTFVPGSVTVTPVANDDAYSLTGNTPITFDATSGLLHNDTDADSSTPNSNVGLTVSSVDTTGTHGTVAFNSDGSFTFTPQTGYVGTTSFAYNVTDASGLHAVDTGIVTLTITGEVWYVDGTYGGANGASDGSYLKPFTTLTPLNGAGGAGDPDGSNDTIFVYNHGTNSGNIALEAGQKLFGGGHDFTVNGHHISDGSANSTISATSGTIVTLATDNDVEGVTLNANGAGVVGMADNNGSVTSASGTFTASHISFTGAGQAVDIDQGGNLNVTVDSLTSSGSSAQGVQLAGSATSGTGLLSGSFTVNGGAISGSTTQGFQIGDGTAGHGGTITVSDSGTVTKNSAGHIVDVEGHTANAVTFSGDLHALGNANNGILVSNNSGGTINFNDSNGTASAISTGANNAVDLTNNSGATINLQYTSASGLHVTTTSGIGFNATGGGTVNVTGTASAITSTTGVALNIANTTIGASNVTFHSISSNGAASGIVLNNTGSSGGLHVTGDGGATSNASGGTIQSSTGDGVSLNNTEDVRLGYMDIKNNLGDGIGGSTINGFLVNHANISGNGNDAATDESGINLANLTGSISTGGRPTGIFNSAISNNNEFEVQITNNSGTLNNFQISNTAVSANGLAINGNATSPHGNLVNFLGTGTSTMGLTVTNSQFTGNTTSDATHTITGTGVMANSGGTSMVANVSGSTFTNNNAGVDVSTDPVATSLNFNIANNTFTGQRSTAINQFDNGNGPFNRTVNGTITGNTIGTAGVVASGSVVGNGIAIGNEGAVNANLLINNNTIQEIGHTGATGGGFEAISVNVGLSGHATGGGTTNVTISNNNIHDVAGSRGLIIQDNQDTTGGGPYPTINASISGNTFADIAGQAGNGQYMRIKELNGTVNITQATPTTSAIASELDDANGFNDPTKISLSGTPQFNHAAPTQPTTVTLSHAPVGSALSVTSAGSQAEAGISGHGPQAHIVTDGLISDFAIGPWQSAHARDFTGRYFYREASTLSHADTGAVTTGGTAAEQPASATPAPLTQAALDTMVDAAIARWAAAGATPAEIAAMKAVVVTLSDIAGNQVGDATPGHILIDSDGGGYGWFVDATPGSDSEFHGSGSDLTANAGGAAAGRIDLLTTLMHELGHQIGLADNYTTAGAGDLMYGYVNPGERRLPSAADVHAATGTPIAHEAFALSPVSAGTIPTGKAVEVSYRSTVNDYADGTAPTFTNTATVTYNSGSTATSNSETLSPGSTPALDTLTLGDHVYLDTNANHTFDAGEGVSGVALTLFDDANHNGVFDAGTDTQVATTTTGAGGVYSFANLAHGDYIVRVDASNFAPGGALAGDILVPGTATDPDDNVDNDNNGVAGPSGSVVSQAITLAFNSETTADATGHNDINNSLDFGFVANQPPTAVTETLSTDEDTPLMVAATTLLANDTDPDNDTLTVTGVSNAQHGTVAFDGTTVTFTPTGDYNGAASFDYTISDGHGHSATVTDTVNVGAVNDAPVNHVPGAQTVDEGGSLTFTGANTISITDVDAGAGTVTVDLSAGHGTLTLSTESGLTVTGDGTSTVHIEGSLSSINGALNGLVYAPAGDFNGSDTLTITTNDGGNTGGGALSDTDTVAITVGAVNDAPVLGNPTDAAVTYVEDTASPTPLLQGVTVMDPDTPADFAGGGITLTVSGSGGGINPLASSGFTVDGTDLKDSNGDVVGTITGVGTTSVTVTNFTSYATPSVVNQLVQAFGFYVSGDDPDTTDRTVSLTFSDGGNSGSGGPLSDSVSQILHIVAVNDAPVLDLNGSDPGTGNSASYTENNASSALAPGLTIADPDDTNIEGATVKITSGFIANIDYLEVNGGTSGTIGAISFSYDASTGVLSLTGSATLADYESVLRQVGFESTSDTPGTSRTIEWTINDGSADSAAATTTLAVTEVDDPPVAVDDAKTTDEAHVASGNVLTNDTDVDGGPKTVATVNGSAANVGTQITLASGAHLTVNADGSYTYDPNGKFNYLTSTAGGETGAVDTQATDTFTYTDNGGSTATVTVTINGLATNDDILKGDSGNNTITGTPHNDVFDLSQGGDDHVSGLGGVDAFLFGATFNAADQVDGGAGNNDQIGLQGDYTGANALVMGANTIANIEVIAALAGYDYDITTNDGNVAAGQVLNIYGSALGVGDNLTFNGSAEMDGSFIVYAGMGVDTLTGGAKNDGFYFGPGAFTSADHVDGGAGTNDQIGLEGNYTMTLGGNYTNIEAIILFKGPSSSPDHYNLSVNDDSVTAGHQLTISGTAVTTSITFDGSGEHDGSFRIFGGTAGDSLTGSDGNDVIYGLGGADTLTGGAGSDTFAYTAVSESTGPKYDHITDFDFSTDKIDLPGKIGNAVYDGDFHGGTLSQGSFNANLASDLSGILQANHAVLFEADSGDLAGKWFLVVDANHQAGYQANADYVIQVDFTGSPPPTTEHFII